MLKTHDSSIAESTNNSATPVPAMVLCGQTCAGTSTIARRVAEVAVLEHLNPDSFHDYQQTYDASRLADLRLLDRVTYRVHPAVAESGVLPQLLPVDNTLLVVGVVASTPVRARRLRALFPRMDFAGAIRAVEASDAARNTRMRATWGIDVTAPECRDWQRDLVVGCPEPRACPDESACLDAVTDLIVSAYAVYEHHLSATPVADRRAAVDMFNRLHHRHAAHVRRISPTLMNPTAFTTRAWRGRLLGELQRREGLL